jgi:hypothetical protein
MCKTEKKNPKHGPCEEYEKDEENTIDQALSDEEEKIEIEIKKCTRCNQSKPVSSFGVRKFTGEYYKTCNKCRGIQDEEYDQSLREKNLKCEDKTRKCSRCNKVKESERFGQRRRNGDIYRTCLVCRGLEEKPPPPPPPPKNPNRKCCNCRRHRTEEEFGGYRRCGKKYKKCLECRLKTREPTESELNGDFIMNLEDAIWCNGCVGYKTQKEFGVREKPGGYLYKRCAHCREKQIKRSEKDKCECGINKFNCHKCGSGRFCPHSKKKNLCDICNPNYKCEHNKIKSSCSQCNENGTGGHLRCQHNNRKSICKDCKLLGIGGASRCDAHNKILRNCRECGGEIYCQHNRNKYLCVECCGNSTCEHKKRKHRCPKCCPAGHLAETVRKRVVNALASDKDKSSIEYLGCSIPFYMKYLEDMFEPWMNWSNHSNGPGCWNIDHKIPLMYNNPTMEEVVARLHYTNTQPLSWEENMKKGNRYVG